MTEESKLTKCSEMWFSTLLYLMQFTESRVEMTPKELEQLIEKVIQGVDEDVRKTQTIDDRMDRLERLLLEVNTGTYRENLTPERQENASQRILDKLNELNLKIDSNTNRIKIIANNYVFF